MSCDGGFPVSLYLLSPASVSSVRCENTTLSCQPPLAVYFWTARVTWNCNMYASNSRRLLRFCDCSVTYKRKWWQA